LVNHKKERGGVPPALTSRGGGGDEGGRRYKLNNRGHHFQYTVHYSMEGEGGGLEAV